MRKSSNNTAKSDWEKKLLQKAREIYEHGEGELIFKVRGWFSPKKKKKFKECIILGGKRTRFEERI